MILTIASDNEPLSRLGGSITAHVVKTSSRSERAVVAVDTAEGSAALCPKPRLRLMSYIKLALGSETQCQRSPGHSATAVRQTCSTSG